MDIWQAIVLFIAALLGGGLNSFAGGGSFIAFPALIFTGVPPINANATNTVALWPGSVASTFAYRDELKNQMNMLPMLSLVSLVGGVSGALLLLATPEKTFTILIPYLLLVATLLFTFGNSTVAKIRKQFGRNKPATTDVVEIDENGDIKKNTWGLLVAQFVISVYGGFFGGGIGIMMLALFTLLGMQNINNMNSLKTWLASLINGVAVFTFLIAGAVFWLPGMVMVVGGIAGGYWGARIARKLDQKLVKRGVIVFGFIMTFYFFLRTYGVF